MPNVLTYRILHRLAEDGEAGTRQERFSADFLIDNQSMLKLLTNDGDFMGCFVRGFVTENLRKRLMLSADAPSETEDGRVLLYICPECGDIACGAYATRIQRSSGVVRWLGFAYVNGYEAPIPVEIGPFEFDEEEYGNAIVQASAI